MRQWQTRKVVGGTDNPLRHDEVVSVRRLDVAFHVHHAVTYVFE